MGVVEERRLWAVVEVCKREEMRRCREGGGGKSGIRASNILFGFDMSNFIFEIFQ